MNENGYLHSVHMEGDHVQAYRPSTGELVRKLKGLPEWAGLSTSEAHRALAIGLGKIINANGDPWSLLPDNDIKCIPAEEDFLAAWPKVRGSSIDLAAVVHRAQANPISWSEDLKEKLSPVTARFKLFCDVCLYLQSMVGSQGYILLPQHHLAPLLETRQGGISSYCQRAKGAGFLEELNGGQWSYAQRQAKRWRCSLHLERGLALCKTQR